MEAGGYEWATMSHNAEFTRRNGWRRLRRKPFCGRSDSRRRTKQASRLCAVRDLRRADPSTRGATAPQGAQRVNFVVRWPAKPIDAMALDKEVERQLTQFTYEIRKELTGQRCRNSITNLSHRLRPRA